MGNDDQISKVHASTGLSSAIDQGIVSFNDNRKDEQNWNEAYITSCSKVFSRSRAHPDALHRSITSKTLDADDPAESGLRRPTDVKRKQVFGGTKLLLLAYQSIGVIYGDIGTSPLYVFSSVFGSTPPARNDLIGVLSLIIWSLIMMVTVKYIFIILNADNEGEGGTFSCYSLLSRYSRIVHRDPREEYLVEIQRHASNEMSPANLKVRDSMERSELFKGLLKAIGVLAVSMVIADGVLTPAQSVLGAIQGLNVVVPDISNGTVVGATCGILIALFAIQPLGTGRIGSFFAPVIVVWLGLLAGFGIYNLVHYDAGVFIAFNPGEAFSYLIRRKEPGWHSLSGVLLAFTGVEALFADLGAFSKRAIQISWLGWCLPSLLLAYIGQAAYISVHPEAYAYPVFNTAPPGCLIPALVVGILAAIVASQAITTATFQLLRLSYFPQIQVKHTSKIFHNQLYVPLANYLLMIGAVVVTAVYRNTTSLGNAYGVCVMFVTFFDTCMITLVALIVWRIKVYLVVFPALAIMLLDGAYLSAALTKVPLGAWFTIVLATILACVFVLWRFGKEQQWAAEKEDRLPLSRFVELDANGQFVLAPMNGQRGGEVLSKSRGFSVFFDKGGINTPQVFSHFISKLVSTPEVIIFFHMRPLEYPTIPAAERFVVSQIRSLPNCYRVVCRHGYMDEVISPDLAAVIYSHLKAYLVDKTRPSCPNPQPDDFSATSSAVDGELEVTGSPEKEIDAGLTTSAVELPNASALELVEQAYRHRVLYVVGKEEMHIRKGASFWRLIVLKTFLFLRENSRGKIQNLKVPTDRLVEIGFVKDI